MKLQPRHIFLIIGAILTITSFYYYVSAHTTYVKLLSIGLATALIATLLIWLKDTIRIKILWLAITALLVIVQQVTEQSAIKQSTKWMIQKNEDILHQVSMTLISKPGNFIILKTYKQDRSALFTDLEWKKINKLFHKTDIKLISKDSARIYYEVYGMLDARIGFSCSYTISPTDFGTGMKTYFLKWNY
jgi:hypothetical protein